jgi:hypothetical protein
MAPTGADGNAAKAVSNEQTNDTMGTLYHLGRLLTCSHILIGHATSPADPSRDGRDGGKTPTNTSAGPESKKKAGQQTQFTPKQLAFFDKHFPAYKQASGCSRPAVNHLYKTTIFPAWLDEFPPDKYLDWLVPPTTLQRAKSAKKGKAKAKKDESSNKDEDEENNNHDKDDKPDNDEPDDKPDDEPDDEPNDEPDEENADAPADEDNDKSEDGNAEASSVPRQTAVPFMTYKERMEEMSKVCYVFILIVSTGSQIGHRKLKGGFAT